MRDRYQLDDDLDDRDGDGDLSLDALVDSLLEPADDEDDEL